MEELSPDEQRTHNTCLRLAAEKEAARLKFIEVGEALNNLREKCTHQWAWTGCKKQECLICGDTKFVYGKGW